MKFKFSVIKKKLRKSRFRPFYTPVFFILGVYILTILFTALGKSWMGTGGWQFVFEDEFSEQNAQPEVFNTLAVNGSSLYFAVTNGYTYSIDRISGTLHWKHEANNASIYPIAFGTNDLLYLTNFDGKLYAVNKGTGLESWRFKVPGLFMADTEPILSGDTVFFGSRDGNLFAVDAATGVQKWNFQKKQVDISRFNPDEIIVHFGRFSVDDTHVYINSSTDNALIALDKDTGKEKWRFENYGFYFQKPIIFPTSISIMNNKDMYYILDKETGKKLFETHVLSRFIVNGIDRGYVYSKNNTIDAVDASNGKVLWSLPVRRRPDAMAEMDSSDFVLAVHNGDTSNVMLVNGVNGEVQWTREIEGSVITNLFFRDDSIFAIGNNGQCLLNRSGNVQWCTKETTHVMKSLLGTNSLYLISTEDNVTTDVTLIDSNKGVLIWRYKADNIGTRVITVYEDDLYFVSKDRKSIVRLSHTFNEKQMESKHIKRISENDPQDLKIITDAYASATDLLHSFYTAVFKSNEIIIRNSSELAHVNGVTEFTIHLDERYVKNKFTDVDIVGTFTDGGKNSYRIEGFYYGKDTWKLRFSPPEVKNWKWSIQVKNGLMRASEHGELQSEASSEPGFIYLSQKDPRLFTDSNGNIFEPVGIQDCTVDYNQDGDPLNQWFLGDALKASTAVTSYPMESLDEYLSEYGESGFNMFRWGVENCSFPLWKSLSPDGNRYGVNEGLRVDTLFSALRKHNFHIWMSLFSFKLPFEGNIAEPHTQAIVKSYLDYIVARYGSYVDVWELANEIKLDDELITFMSDYIRSIDPYHHPVTTSWERPDMSVIDISSVHWYSQVCTLCHFDDLNHQIITHKDVKKPVVYSEQGNWQASWDHLSAERMRIRLWVGFFENLSYIFWNNSKNFWINVQGTSQGPSNIYMGPLERQYVSVFSSYIADVKDSFEDYIAVSDEKVYSRKSGNKILGYMFRQEIGGPEKPTTITVNLPQNGKIIWLNPSTGKSLAEYQIQRGTQVLSSPVFSTDIAFTITLSDVRENLQTATSSAMLKVLTPKVQVGVFDVFELSLDTAGFGNSLQQENEIIGYFTDSQGFTHKSKAFYYDLDRWKIRFAPSLAGEWKWEVKITGIEQASASGRLTAIQSENPGFISVSRTDTRLFTTAKGNIFMPIGIEDCVEGHNRDGDPLNQWFMGTDIKLTTSFSSYPIASLETYLSEYGKSGFNMFRWGAENCSFPLWKALIPEGNRFGVNEGIRVDALFSSLRRSGFHIWMNVSSFVRPFKEKTMDVESYALLKSYLDYVVARYGSYVDVWELPKPSGPEDTLTKFITEYLHTIDPYHHPITTTNNPVVYSMQGNWRSNWEERFSMGMRIRLWVGFFNKKSYTFWDTSRRMWLNIPWSTEGLSMILQDSAERQFASVFSEFIKGIGEKLLEYPMGSPDKVYSFMSDKTLYGYVYKPISNGSVKPTSLYARIPHTGTLYWISPVTGSVIGYESVKKGDVILTSPGFTTDIAFKIVPSAEPVQ